MDRETVMHMWDERRAEIANGDRSSAPRDWFEALLDALDDERGEAVLAERETCAALAEDTAAGRDAEAIAEAIRMRSNA